MEDDHDWGLVVPFLTDDPVFAYGVEFGMLFMEMKDADAVEGIYCRKNQDQILLLASRLKWKVEKMEPVDDDWFFLSMTR